MNFPPIRIELQSFRVWPDLRVITCVCSLAAMLMLAGCGPSELKPAGGPEDAVEAVNDALRAWKAGEKEEDVLTDLNIRVVDVDWAAGTKLLNYTVDKTAKLDGSNWRVDAVLMFGVPGQQASYPNQAAYTVTLAPSVCVFRLDTLN